MRHLLPIENFHQLASQARRRKLVLVVMVSRKDCPYCHRLRREVMEPMIKGGDFAGEILLGELFIDEGETVVDFHGRRVDAADLAHGYGVSLTPTVLFLAPDGRELAEKMVGITVMEMYFHYLSEAIDEAVKKLRSGAS